MHTFMQVCVDVPYLVDSLIRYALYVMQKCAAALSGRKEIKNFDWFIFLCIICYMLYAKVCALLKGFEIHEMQSISIT